MTLDITVGWLGEEIEGQDLEAVVAGVRRNFEQLLGDVIHLELLDEPLAPALPANPALPPDAVFAPAANPCIVDYLEKSNREMGHTLALVTPGPLYTLFLFDYIAEVSGIYTPKDRLTLINGRRLTALPGDTTMYLANVLTHELGHTLGLDDYRALEGEWRDLHDSHCFMIQTSGNPETLPREIASRQYFCRECSSRLRRWHDSIIK